MKPWFAWVNIIANRYSGVDAITGGTGKYAGVRGERRFEMRGNKVISTFRFID
jgi:hypothetical protein